MGIDTEYLFNRFLEPVPAPWSEKLESVGGRDGARIQSGVYEP